MDIIKGKLWIINEEDVNTDLIFAGKYTYEQLTPEEMGKKALEDFDKDFHNKLSPGDFIVSGKNFGHRFLLRRRANDEPHRRLARSTGGADGRHGNARRATAERRYGPGHVF